MEKEKTVLTAKGISKSFSSVQVLKDVDFDLTCGELHCLMGENGAGKSTLIKIISGVYLPDTGEITVNGKKVSIENPHDAFSLGIGTIHQETSLVSYQSVAFNMFLGHEYATKQGILKKKALMEQQCRQVFQSMGVSINPKSLVKELTAGQQQLVQIAKSMLFDNKILIMDEPTASLSESETVELFRIIKDMKSRGISIIYITHRLKEVGEIADRVTIMRDGCVIGTYPWGKLTEKELIARMVGRDIDRSVRRKSRASQEVVLEAKNLVRQPFVKDVSFRLHKGEVLGFAGLVGAGRTETMRLLFGADAKEQGQVIVHGQETEIRSPAQAVEKGISYLSEDRKQFGFVDIMSVKENTTLASLSMLVRHGKLNHRKEAKAAQGMVEKLSVRTESIDKKMMYLSGGNQQKVIIAKWLLTQSDVLIFDEPTKGIDVGAREEIYGIIDELTEAGKSIILVSSDMPEILRLSDRIIIMREGKIITEFQNGEELTEKDLMVPMFMEVDNEK